MLKLSTELVRSMPRDFKQSLGGKLRDECVEMSILIFRANTNRIKGPHIEVLIEKLQVTELILRLACDLRQISKGQYASAVELTQSIGRQAGGWKRSASSPAS